MPKRTALCIVWFTSLFVVPLPSPDGYGWAPTAVLLFLMADLALPPWVSQDSVGALVVFFGLIQSLVYVAVLGLCSLAIAAGFERMAARTARVLLTAFVALSLVLATAFPIYNSALGGDPFVNLWRLYATAISRW